MNPTPPDIESGKMEPLILTVRGQRVMLDADLAIIYGVQTRVLNQAVRRNRERFPAEFVFQLNAEEAAQALRLRSQFVILKTGRGHHRKYLPFAFSEHGALMAATVLNAPRAVTMSLFIIRAFVKMREDHAANAAILKRLAEIDKTLLTHDAALRDIYKKLRPLLAPPPEPEKREIGFHIKEDATPYRISRMTARS
ncbi:MAG: ORF6N domain-containing protein [Verrucomicrobiales bacterium]|nr:ORF6N domain-containing protein [Verrucomicrobiales bacterium]